jgi:dihydroorotase
MNTPNMNTLNLSKTLVLDSPIDAHVHLRDGVILAGTANATARQFGAAIIMPNLKPPITTVAQALAYHDAIMAVLPQNIATSFKPYLCLYLTENTTADEVQRVADNFKDTAKVIGFKLYPAGATTNSDAGVRDLLASCAAALNAMQRLNVPLLVHGEVTDPSVDLFDREAVFIDRVMLPLRAAYPALKVVFEHITTLQAAQYVMNAPANEPIAASITPQHLLYNRNAIFTGGLRPHYYCLPVLKREAHRLELLKAATSANPRFFLGTDTAPHAKHLKESACGCAGCYTSFHALELYATAFESVGALSQLNAFASQHASDFYGIPKPTGTVTLQRQSWTIPDTVEVAGTAIVPLAAGDTLAWKMV